MPPYTSAPGTNSPVLLALEGQINYAFGAKNQNQADTVLFVTKVSRTGGTATYTVTVREGNIPVVGALLTVRGLATSAFNLSNQAITGVSINSTTGIGTVTIALAGSTSDTPDAGAGYVPVPITFEALANGASQAFAIQMATGENANAKTITWQTLFGSAPAGITVSLQFAEENVDADYATFDSSTSTTGEIRSYQGVASRFMRFLISGISGAAPTGSVSFWM